MQYTAIICAAFVALLALTFPTASAFPQDVNLTDDQRQAVNSLLDELPEATHQAAVENLRLKRATCDLASGFGVDHSLCATHCVLRGNRGGYCNDKRVCVCRN